MHRAFKIIQLSLLFIFMAGFVANAQKMTIKMADKSYNDFAFVEAIELYEYAYDKDPENAYVIRRLADSNRNIGNTEEVEKWLKILIDSRNDEPEDLFNYSQALKSNGRYLEAEQWLKEYSEIRPEDGRINIQASLLEYIQFLHRDSSRYVVRHLSINTEGSEMGPAYYRDQVVFASTNFRSDVIERKYKWNDLPYLDLYLGDAAESGDLINVKPFAPKLKTTYHDGPVSFDQKEDKMYLTRNNVGKTGATKGKEGAVNLKILFAGVEDEKWEYRGEFPFNSNDYSVGHPAIDKSGKVLYFASDMPGGYGGSDIYFSTFSNGFWSEPFNLGPKVNTEGNEFFPFISNDGVLYFSSNGHGGIGGLDVFFSVPERGVFNTVENMGYPINSPKDDFGFVLNSISTEGYFASDRKGGRGSDDLYYFLIKYVPVIIRGVAKERESREILPDTKISIINEYADTIFTSTTGRDGQFEFEVNKGMEYIVRGTKEFYFPSETVVETNDLRPNDEAFVELFLEVEPEDDSPEPIKMEEEDGEPLQIIEMEFVEYEEGSAILTEKTINMLDRLIAIMKKYPEMEVRLESHTDSRGDDEENMLLSKRRARAAFEYISERGIDPDRVEYEGYGETRLLNKCDDGADCTEAEHAANNRTIVKVVKKGEYKGKRNKRSIFYF
ncbi:OmpA family protein [Sunxiuqinia sp. A32]|uniref:OmpA family protein n=1 Tax=Sunxiuqinia sp. A32 TaxID=3461496 RepID=UPI0040463F75